MAPPVCVVCSATANLVCGDYKATTYCSGSCQEKDSPLHGLLCDALRVFIEKFPRPASTRKTAYKLALLFTHEHMNYLGPSLVWIETEIVSEVDHQYFVSCDVSKVYNVAKDDPKAVIHSLNSKSVEIWSSGEVQEYHERNSDIGFLITGGMRFRIPYEADVPYGPILVMAIARLWDNVVDDYRDIEATDLRVALSYFLKGVYCFEINGDTDYLDTNPWIIFEQPEWIKAVRVHNTMVDSDSPHFNSSNLQTIMLNRNHPKIARYDDKSKNSERMGIPLLFRKTPTEAECFHQKIQAMDMFINFDTSDDNEFWGKVPWFKYGERRVPTYLVFREDGKDISRQQVEAISTYCSWVLDRVFEGPEGWELTSEDKELLVDTCCAAEKFNDHFIRYKAQKLAEGDDDWKDVEPPIGMRVAGARDAKSAVQKESPDDEDDETPEGRRRRLLSHAEYSAATAWELCKTQD